MASQPIHIKIQTNLSILEKDRNSGFINNKEYNMLYSHYLVYKEKNDENKADELLGKLMSAYYKNRYEKRMAKKREEEKDMPETSDSEDSKLSAFEERKRKMYLESTERKREAVKKAKHISSKYDGLVGGVNKRTADMARFKSISDSYKHTME